MEFIPIYGILGLLRKEATTVGSLRFTEIQSRPLRRVVYLQRADNSSRL
jgi:hypothetical protein